MITVSSLTKQYGQRTAVDDLTFDVAAGRVTGFVGPNGAGKSTTMRMMVGLTRPDRGDTTYRGVSYPAMLHPARLVGTVLDARSMHPGRTARNHLSAAAALASIPARRVGEVLTEVGLDSAADQRTGGFSLGMRQRLALAGALLGEPARGESTVCVRTPELADLGRLLERHGMEAETQADQLSVRSTTTTAVSQIAFDNHIQITEITETRRSLEEILLDITRSSAEFAAA